MESEKELLTTNVTEMADGVESIRDYITSITKDLKIIKEENDRMMKTLDIDQSVRPSIFLEPENGCNVACCSIF